MRPSQRGPARDWILTVTPLCRPDKPLWWDQIGRWLGLPEYTRLLSKPRSRSGPGFHCGGQRGRYASSEIRTEIRACGRARKEKGRGRFRRRRVSLTLTGPLICLEFVSFRSNGRKRAAWHFSRTARRNSISCCEHQIPATNRFVPSGPTSFHKATRQSRNPP